MKRMYFPARRAQRRLEAEARQVQRDKRGDAVQLAMLPTDSWRERSRLTRRLGK